MDGGHRGLLRPYRHPSLARRLRGTQRRHAGWPRRLVGRRTAGTSGERGDGADGPHPRRLALGEIGEIRLRRGDLLDAEEAFARATELGSTSHPGVALLRLARGDVRGAAAAIAVVLAETAEDGLARGRLLPAQVEIALAEGDMATARLATAELSAIATRYAHAALAAAAACAHGALTLASNDAATAVGLLRGGVA